MSALLPAADLTWMRTEQDRAQPGTAIIYRRADVADNMGGYDESWSAVGTVTARLYPQKLEEREMVAGQQIISKSRWFVTMPNGTSVLAQDRIEMDSRTFEVTFVNNDEGYKTAVRAEVVAHNEEQRL